VPRREAERAANRGCESVGGEPSPGEALADLFAGREPDNVPQAAAGLRQKQRVREFYDTINDGLNGSIFARDAIFLNFGYLADGHPRSSPIELPERLANRNRVDLVLELIGACDLAGCDVLDIGCGRGGTIYTLDRFFGAGEIWGLDLSPSAIAFCRHRIGNRHIHFVNGDSERLPFLGGFFDAVTNVESSCLYADIYAFYREVWRVLAPGGRFFYTDILPAAHLESYKDCLLGLGMTLERDQDITGNVLRSLDADAERHFEVHGRKIDQEVMAFFLAAPGSRPYRDLQERRLSYRIWQLRKDG